MVDPRALFECILWLRGVFSACGFEFQYSDLAARTHIQRFDIGLDSGRPVADGVPSVVFDCTGMLHDGLVRDCGHWGGKSIGDTYIRHTHVVYHGTKNLEGVLRCNGVMHEAQNTCAGKRGWFHSKSLSQAYGYASTVQGFKVVLKFHSRCFHSCEGGRSWYYTKADCRNYVIAGIILIPDTASLPLLSSTFRIVLPAFDLRHSLCMQPPWGFPI